MIDSPFGGAPERPQDGISRVQKLAAVEIGFCGAHACFRGIWVYIGGRSTSMDLRAVDEAGGRAQGGGRAPTLVGSPRLFWSISDTPWASSGPKISSVKFQVNWTPFDFPFLRYSKTRKKQKLALGSRLIG